MYSAITRMITLTTRTAYDGARQRIGLRHTCQWQADLNCLEAYVVNSILLLLAGPPGGAGSQHGVSVPVWLIVAAVVVIVVVGVIGVLRRRR